MRFLLEPQPATSLQGVVHAGLAARDAGLDGVLITASAALPAPLVTAAAVASVVDGILIAAEVVLGDRHPLEVAEEAAVVDLAAAGRLVLVAAPAEGHDERFAEALDIVRAALAARPFRFEGRFWTVPAGLLQNVHGGGGRTRSTPAAFQPQLSIWTSGDHAGLGPHRGVGHLAAAADDYEAVSDMWRAASAALGPALIGAPRARRETWSGADDLLERLRAGRRAFDQDWAVVFAEASAAQEIGARVRPRIQLDRLPDGLERHWAQ